MSPKIVGITLAALALTVIILAWMPSQTTDAQLVPRAPGVTSAERPKMPPQQQPSSTRGTRSLRGTYWCGESFDDAALIGIAVSRGDTAAIAGLLERGKAFQVEGGTRVTSGGEIDMGISLVHIESGYQVGRKCYISTNALN
jgi:hypothetical protein